MKPRRPATLALLLLAAAAAPAAAQPAAAPAVERTATQSPDAAPRWSYGIFVHHLGAAKRWTVGGQPFIEDNNIGRFIAKIGGDSTEVPHRNDPEETWNVAVLAILGRQGWELVNCEVFGQEFRESYFCYLKKPLAPAAP